MHSNFLLLESTIKLIKRLTYQTLKQKRLPISQWHRVIFPLIDAWNRTKNNTTNKVPALTTVADDVSIKAYLRRHKRTSNALYPSDFLKGYQKVILALRKFYTPPTAKDLLNTSMDNFRYKQQGSSRQSLSFFISALFHPLLLCSICRSKCYHAERQVRFIQEISRKTKSFSVRYRM